MSLIPLFEYSLLSWMFAGLSNGKQLQSWIIAKEERMHQGMGILQTFEKEEM